MRVGTCSGVTSAGMVISSAFLGTSSAYSSLTNDKISDVFPTPGSPTRRILTFLRGAAERCTILTNQKQIVYQHYVMPHHNLTYPKIKTRTRKIPFQFLYSKLFIQISSKTTSSKLKFCVPKNWLWIISNAKKGKVIWCYEKRQKLCSTRYRIITVLTHFYVMKIENENHAKMQIF